MALLLAFAFASGLITILSPCILPVLPLVLSGGIGGKKARPFGVIAGFAASFALFTLTLSAIVQTLDIPAEILRYVAVAIILGFGIVMLLPAVRDRFELFASKLANRGSATKKPRTGGGFLSGLPLGFGLGLVWTPCVGPIMASVIGLAISRRIDGGSILITLAYTFGTAVPMLAIMLGGRKLLDKVPALSRRGASIQRIFGALMIVLALSIAFGLDRRFQTALLSAFPSYGSGLTGFENTKAVNDALRNREASRSLTTTVSTGNGIPADAIDTSGLFNGSSEASKNGDTADYGLAPPLKEAGAWFNSPQLSMESLRGKVVLIDFWTYSCVNCIRTLPYLKSWHERYGGKGLVIIGVHSPEFAFERDERNVKRAIADLGIAWPVVQDNDFALWNAYANRFWPAHYFVDAKGKVRYIHYGEGGYEESVKVIEELLREAGASSEKNSATAASVAPAQVAVNPGPVASSTVPAAVSGVASTVPATTTTEETYLGYGRGSGFASAVTPLPDQATLYKPARIPESGEWNLEGIWTVSREFSVPEKSGSLELGFRAKDVFLVVEPEDVRAGRTGSIEVWIDGKPGADTSDVKNSSLLPTTSRLYHIVGLPESSTHLLRLHVNGRLRLYAFTFG